MNGGKTETATCPTRSGRSSWSCTSAPWTSGSSTPGRAYIGRTFRREDVPPLYGHTFNPGNWNSGHVSLGEDVVLFITLHKTAGVEGADYNDRLDGPGVLVWSSQTSTGPDTKKGREVLAAPAEGRRIHAWVRRCKADVAFEYRGLVVPLSHIGDRPMSVRFRLLTPLDREAMLRLQWGQMARPKGLPHGICKEANMGDRTDADRTGRWP